MTDAEHPIPSCCSPAAQERCCDPADKAACCDATEAGEPCGCDAAETEQDVHDHAASVIVRARRP